MMDSNLSIYNLKDRFLSFLAKNKQDILYCIILSLGVFLRIYLFSDHPAGLNQDEASIGYDAWSVLHYGIDRNGTFMPVHHIAWGSGQNALYSYFSMPFIALFGLNTFSVRFVNLLFSIISIIAVYSIVKRFTRTKTAMIAMALIAFSPWNIMLSRWGLESNLFPAMFILAFWALTKAFDKHNYLLLSAFMFALSLYSYGAAYAVVPLFCLIAAIYIVAKKLIPVRTCLYAMVVFIVTALPIGLFIIVNYFKLGDISLGFFTIPQMTGVWRAKTMTDSSILGVPLRDAVSNFFRNVVFQTDYANRNAFAYYGCFYIFSFPFWITGIVSAFRKKGTFNVLLLAAFFSSISLFLIYSYTNINRVNAVYIPLIILTAMGISELFKSKTGLAGLIIAYSIFLGGFTLQYFGKQYKQEIGNEFFYSLDEAIMKAEELADEDDTIYVTNHVNMPYIYVLFYTQPAPREYTETVRFVGDNKDVEFQQVESFGRYKFNINDIYKKEKGVYILTNSQASGVSDVNEVYKFQNYSVIVIR